jgi:hypothetical protein
MGEFGGLGLEKEREGKGGGFAGTTATNKCEVEWTSSKRWQ